MKKSGLSAMIRVVFIAAGTIVAMALFQDKFKKYIFADQSQAINP